MGAEWLFDFVTSPLLGGYETHDEHETGSKSKIRDPSHFPHDCLVCHRTIVSFVTNMRGFVLSKWVIYMAIVLAIDLRMVIIF